MCLVDYEVVKKDLNLCDFNKNEDIMKILFCNRLVSKIIDMKGMFIEKLNNEYLKKLVEKVFVKLCELEINKTSKDYELTEMLDLLDIIQETLVVM